MRGNVNISDTYKREQIKWKKGRNAGDAQVMKEARKGEGKKSKYRHA